MSGSDLKALLPPLADVSGYSDEDLEALVRGPGAPLNPADLPSSSPESSDDEGFDDVQLENESEQEEPRNKIQNARQAFVPSDYSSDEDSDVNDGIDEEIHPRPTLNSISPAIAPIGELTAEASSMDEPLREISSFQKMGTRSSSAEPDEAGNKAFEDILAQENAILDLSRHELTPSNLKATIPVVLKASSQHGKPSTAKEPEIELGEEEPHVINLRNGHAPGDASAQNLGLDPEEAGDNLKIGPPAGAQSLSSVELAQDGTSLIPSAPPSEQSQQEPARESTPKPGTMQRMKSRVGLAPPAKKPPLNSRSTSTPAAKPPRTVVAIATLRNQQKRRTRSQSIKLGHEDSEVVTMKTVTKPVSEKDPVTPVAKSISTRSKLSDKNLEDFVENQGQSKSLPRRSSRTALKTGGASSQATPIVSLKDPPPSKRIRQIKPPPVSEGPSKTSQSQASEVTEGREQPKQSTVVAGPSSTTSIIEDTQPDEQIPLPPSPPVSLHAWETLQTLETPLTITQSDPMIDELHSDTDPIPFPLKPQYQRKMSTFGHKKSFSQLDQVFHNPEDREGGNRNEESTPRSNSSEIQPSFPHSQPATLVATDSSDSENEVQNVVATRPQLSQPQPSRYRKLSDIAGQAKGLFTPKILRQSVGPLQAATAIKRNDRLHQLYGRMGKKGGHDEISDYESEADSDSEVEKVSHIPKSRKAGAGLKSRASVV